MRIKVNQLSFVLFTVIVCSCSPIKRLERFQKNHSYLFTAKLDTIHHHDTIDFVVPGEKINGAFHQSNLLDTISIKGDNISASAWQVGDTIYLEAEADTIEIFIPYYVEIPVTRYEIPPLPPDTWFDLLVKDVWFWIAVLVIIGIGVYYFKKS